MYCTAYEMLGGEKRHYQSSPSSIDVINVLRRGLTVDMLEKASQLLGMDQVIFAELIGLNTHSFRRKRHSEDYRIPAKQSEHTLMIVNVLVQAERYFGERERALKWLNEPNTTFINASPTSLLNTITGIKTVSETLTRMAHGMTA